MTIINRESDTGVRDDAQMVPGISIQNLLQQREAVLERLLQAIDLLIEAEVIATGAGLKFPYVELSKTYGNGRGETIAGGYREGDQARVFEAGRKCIDASGWRYLMGESGLRSVMSASRRQAFEKQLDESDIPPMTHDTVRETFKTLHAARLDMMNEGVIECFKNLSWDYKTNNPVKFGKRIIITYVSEYRVSCAFASRRATDTLDDLMRVFHLIDKKPEADHRQGCYLWISNALDDRSDFPKIAENDYLSIKLFRNGNGHVTFKRPDLTEALNKIIARHFPGALPAPR